MRCVSQSFGGDIGFGPFETDGAERGETIRRWSDHFPTQLKLQTGPDVLQFRRFYGERQVAIMTSTALFPIEKACIA